MFRSTAFTCRKRCRRQFCAPIIHAPPIPTFLLYPIIKGGLGVPEANPNNGDSEQHRSQDRDKRLQNPCVSCRGGQGGLCFGAKHVTVATAEQVDPSPLQMPQLSRYPLS